MVFKIKKTKKGRFIVLEKIEGKKGFGSTVIKGNFSSRNEAQDYIKNQ